VLKESAEEEPWLKFAPVARDLAGEQALDTMPLAMRIAARTVEAFKHRGRASGGSFGSPPKHVLAGSTSAK
jgi:hypothetical protein